MSNQTATSTSSTAPVVEKQINLLLEKQ